MCDCIKNLNKALAPEHSVYATMALHPGVVERAIVPLTRTDKWTMETRRTKPRFVQAEFCPWCGQPYQMTHRHLKRGTTYARIGEGEVQASAPIKEGDKLTAYVGEDGKLWLRPTEEFGDGRFEPLKGSEG